MNEPPLFVSKDLKFQALEAWAFGSELQELKTNFCSLKTFAKNASFRDLLLQAMSPENPAFGRCPHSASFWHQHLCVVLEVSPRWLSRSPLLILSFPFYYFLPFCIIKIYIFFCFLTLLYFIFLLSLLLLISWIKTITPVRILCFLFLQFVFFPTNSLLHVFFFAGSFFQFSVVYFFCQVFTNFW